MKLNKQQVEDLRRVSTYGIEHELRNAEERLFDMGTGALTRLPGADVDVWQTRMDAVVANFNKQHSPETCQALEKLLLISDGHVACAMLRLRAALPPDPMASKYETGGDRIIARVVLQEWDGDYARDIKEVEVDVTESILDQTWSDLDGLADCDYSSDDLPAIQQMLVDEDHNGPFSVYVTEAVDAYLERNGLPEININEPADKWDAHRKSRQLKTNV